MVSPWVRRESGYSNAEANWLKGFSVRPNTAGHYWPAGFMKWHPNFSLMKSEDLSVGRAMGMKQTNHWFKTYQEMIARLGIENNPSHILRKVIRVPQRPVGFRSVSVPTMTITPGGGMNAIGKISPPMIIHTGKRVGKNWWNGAMHNTVNSLFTTNPLLQPLHHYEHIWKVPTSCHFVLM